MMIAGTPRTIPPRIATSTPTIATFGPQFE